MRFLLAVAAALILAGPAQDACPGADPCPYTASSVAGLRSGGVLRFPLAVAIRPGGAAYVGDQYSHAVQVFGPDGTFKRELGATAKGPGGLSSIGGVAVAPDGSVYVADGADRIDRFAQDGTLLDSWGSTGTAPGKFHFGAGGGNEYGAGGGVAVSNGSVYVADTRNDRIQRFAADGSHPVVIVPEGRLLRPQGLAVIGSPVVVGRGRPPPAGDLPHRRALHPHRRLRPGPAARPAHEPVRRRRRSFRSALRRRRP